MTHLDSYKKATYVAAGAAMLTISGVVLAVGVKALPVLSAAHETIVKIGTVADAVPVKLDVGVVNVQDELSKQMTAVADNLVGEVRASRIDAVHQITALRADLVQEADYARADLSETVAFGFNLVDTHATNVEKLIATPLNSAGDALSEFNVIEHDIRPQIGGLLGASKITMGETAQTLKIVRDAAPQFVRSQEKIAEHIEAITNDVAIITDKVVKPKTKKQVLLELLIPTALIGSRFF